MMSLIVVHPFFTHVSNWNAAPISLPARAAFRQHLGMADWLHLIGERLSPAMGDHVPNPMDANYVF